MLYRLFYKMISILGTPGMANRCKYHHLVHGPQKFDMNLEICSCLFKVIDVQIGIMGALVRQSSVPKVHDTISLKLDRVIKFMDVFLYHEERKSHHSLNGLPHKFEFIM